MARRCCRRTKPIRKASTTSPACCRCRRRCWRTTCRPRARSAAWPSAIPTLSPVDRHASRSRRRWCRTSGSSDDLPFGSRGGALIRYHFPLDAEYTIKVLLRRQEYDYIIGMGEPHQLDFRLDGVLLKRFTVGGEGEGDDDAGELRRQHAGRSRVGRVHAHGRRASRSARAREGGPSRGRRVVRRTVLGTRRRAAAAANGLRPHDERVLPRQSGGGVRDRLAVRTARRRRATRRAAARCSSAAEGHAPSEEPCAQEDSVDARDARLSASRHRATTSRRCWVSTRRDAPKASFDAGIQRGLERILAAPSFLFRVEREPAARRRAPPIGSSDLDLASRLSFFLWSSIPDDELLRCGGSRQR